MVDSEKPKKPRKSLPNGNGRSEQVNNLQGEAEKLLGATNSGAQEVRTLFVTYLLYALYLALITGATTHEQLVKGDIVKLPLIDAHIPLIAFYVIAPLLLVLLHFWLWTHFALIAENLHNLKRKLIALREGGEAAHADLMRQQLENFTLLHALTQDLKEKREYSQQFAAMLTTINVLVLAVAPWCVLMLVLATFLPYHSLVITWWHRVLLCADVLLIAVFWPRVVDGARDSLSKWIRTALQQFLRVLPALVMWCLALALWLVDENLNLRSGPISTEMPELIWVTIECLAIAFAFAGVAWLCRPKHVFAVSWLVTLGWSALLVAFGVLTFSEERQSYSDYRDLWTGFCRSVAPAEKKCEELWKRTRSNRMRYVFDNHRLVPRALSLDETVLVGGKPSEETLTKLRRGDEETRKSIVPIDLRGRELRHASFERAVLPRAQLDGAQLQDASLFSAQLQDASLVKAQLQGARMQWAQIQGANLYAAQLQGANLNLAVLQGASLDAAQLQGASLFRAELQGASLERRPQLQGATLDEARLQGARLYGAQLQGANLEGAQLQGASLDGAELQGVSLRRADLRAANGVNLRFGLTLFEGVKVGKWPVDDYEKWKKSLLEPNSPSSESARTVGNVTMSVYLGEPLAKLDKVVHEQRSSNLSFNPNTAVNPACVGSEIAGKRCASGISSLAELQSGFLRIACDRRPDLNTGVYGLAGLAKNFAQYVSLERAVNDNELASVRVKLAQELAAADCPLNWSDRRAVTKLFEVLAELDQRARQAESKKPDAKPTKNNQDMPPTALPLWHGFGDLLRKELQKAGRLSKDM